MLAITEKLKGKKVVKRGKRAEKRASDKENNGESPNNYNAEMKRIRSKIKETEPEVTHIKSIFKIIVCTGYNRWNSPQPGLGPKMHWKFSRLTQNLLYLNSLLKRASLHCIKGVALALLRSYLTDREQQILLHDALINY